MRLRTTRFQIRALGSCRLQGAPMNKLFRTGKLLVFGFIVLTAAVTVQAQNRTNWSSLDQYINSSMKDWKVPGASVAIVRDGAVVYMKGFGVRDIRTNQPVTTDTLFDIGSCTKAFTSAAVAMLVDEG